MGSSIHQDRLDKLINDVNIYPVSCEVLCEGRTDVEWLDGVLAGGAKIVQLRDKISSDLDLFNKAVLFRKKTKEAGALLIINNRLDIALACGADGIHLGNSDIPAQEARRLAPDLIIGVSANTEEQAASAQKRGASYYNIGPIYPTQTKKGLSSFLGCQAIESFSKLSPLPFTVMGGIKLEHACELTQKGAQRIAVVTALTKARDICLETQKWIKEIKKCLSTKP